MNSTKIRLFLIWYNLQENLKRYFSLQLCNALGPNPECQIVLKQWCRNISFEGWIYCRNIYLSYLPDTVFLFIQCSIDIVQWGFETWLIEGRISNGQAKAMAIVVYCCKLNNTRVCDEHIYIVGCCKYHYSLVTKWHLVT